MIMITQEEMKAIKKIIQKKNFNPALWRLWYVKDSNVWVATDSYILLEIKNTIEWLENWFSIDIQDLDKIKDIFWIVIENWIANIIQSKCETLVKIETNDFTMKYEHLKEKPDWDVGNILINKNIAKFFELCSLLWLKQLFWKDTNLYAKNDNYYLMTQKLVSN